MEKEIAIYFVVCMIIDKKTEKDTIEISNFSLNHLFCFSQIDFRFIVRLLTDEDSFSFSM